MDPTIVAALMAAIASLSGAIVYLWRYISDVQKKTESKLEECENAHKASHESMLSLTREVGELKGRQQGVTELAEKVLQEISKTKETKCT